MTLRADHPGEAAALAARMATAPGD